MATHCIVDTLPGEQLPVQGSHFQGEVVDLIELLGVGALCPLYGTIELGRTRGSTKSLIPRSWQACSKPAWNSEPPSDLDGLYGERHPGLESIQEAHGRVGGGPRSLSDDF